MEARDDTTGVINLEVTDIVAVEPISEADVSAVAETLAGYAVVNELSVEVVPEDMSPDLSEDAALKLLEPEEIPLHKNGHLRDVIECMLFVSTEPMTAAQMAETLELELPRVEEALESLQDKLSTEGALQLMKLAGGYQLCTRPEYSNYCAMILQPAKKKLSKAALETLAVTAYRQPCTMPEIEAVRGVSVDGVMKTLIERGLVREAGRKQAPGRPILYATTPEFLEYFGLNDISELPDIDMLAVEEVKALEAQKELISSETGDDAEPGDPEISTDKE